MQQPAFANPVDIHPAAPSAHSRLPSSEKATAPHRGMVQREPIWAFDRQQIRSRLKWASGIGACALSYLGYVGTQAAMHGGESKAQTYDPAAGDMGTWEFAVSAAGLVAGTLLPWGITWLRGKCGAGPAPQTALRQLDSLVREAGDKGPLTDAGLQRCIAQMRRITRENAEQVAPVMLMERIARLGAIVPAMGGCASSCRDYTPHLRQIGIIATALDDVAMEFALRGPAIREALVALGDEIAVPSLPQNAMAIAHVLLEHARRTFDSPGAHHGLWDRNAFLVALRGASCFGPHAIPVDEYARAHLGLDALWEGTRPADGKHAKKPSAQAGIKAFLESQADATDIRSVCAYLGTVPLDRLKAEVDAAVRLCLSGDTASQQAEACLAIAKALGQRSDLPEGAFMEGILSPRQAERLIGDLRGEAGDAERTAGLIARVPHLCQLRATRKIVQQATEFLELRGSAAPVLKAALHEGVGRPIAGASAIATANLNQPWLTGRDGGHHVAIHVRAQAT